jgi:hypothetical protein
MHQKKHTPESRQPYGFESRFWLRRLLLKLRPGVGKGRGLNGWERDVVAECVRLSSSSWRVLAQHGLLLSHSVQAWKGSLPLGRSRLRHLHVMMLSVSLLHCCGTVSRPTTFLLYCAKLPLITLQSRGFNNRGTSAWILTASRRCHTSPKQTRITNPSVNQLPRPRRWWCFFYHTTILIPLHKLQNNHTHKLPIDRGLSPILIGGRTDTENLSAAMEFRNQHNPRN